jgi:hypothetical protein
LIICRNCNSYLSPRSPIDGSLWKCVFCGCRNAVIDNEIFSAQSNKNSIEILLNAKHEIGLIHIFYFSLSFSDDSLIKAKVFLFALLRNLPADANCLIFLGSDDSQITLLVPSQGGNASIARFSSLRGLVGLDLSLFFFTKSTVFEAERTLSKVRKSDNSDPHFKAIQLASALSQFTENVPIRFISIVQQISRKRVDLEPLRQSLVRFDLVVAEFSDRALNLGSDIPGSLVILSVYNPALQARHLLQQTTKFQTIFRYRSGGCSCKVVKPIRPFIDTDADAVFLPVIPTEEYPVVLEVLPSDKVTVLTFQFVTKFIVVEKNERRFLLRIANFSFRTTADISEYIQSVNWNAVLWFWCRKVCEREGIGSLSAILRVAATLLKALGERFEEPALKGVCALPRAQLFAGGPGHRDRAIDLLSLCAPRHLWMVPRVDENLHGRTVCQSVDGIAEERDVRELAPSKAARELQMALPVYIPVAGMVPPDCVAISQITLANLKEMAGI